MEKRKKNEIPEEFKISLLTTKRKEKPERFIIFALNEKLVSLEATKDLCLGGGTFKQCSDMFYQLYNDSCQNTPSQKTYISGTSRAPLFEPSV